MASVNLSAGGLFKTRATTRARPEARIVEIVSFDRDAQIDGCFKGVMTGKMIDGPNKDKLITIALADKGSNAKTPKVEDLTSKKHLSHTEVGELVHFDMLLDTGKGHYTASWVNHFYKANDPKFVRPGIMTRVMPVTKYDPAAREAKLQKYDNGAQRYRTEFLHTDEAQATSSLEQVKLVLSEAFQGTQNPIGTEGNRAVVVVGMLADEEGNLSRSERIIWRGWDKEERRPVDIETAVANAIENIGVENIEQIFSLGGKLDIVPMSWLETGKKTSEMVDGVTGKGRAIVDVRAFQLDPAENTKGYGFAPSNVLISHYTDRDENQLPGMRTDKAFRSGAVLPLSAINTPSDAEASNRFYKPMNDARAAQRAAADAERGAPQGSTAPAEQAKVETKAASADASTPVEVVQTDAGKTEAPAVANKAAELLSSQMADDAPDVIEGLDDILDDIAMDEFAPG